MEGTGEVGSLGGAQGFEPLVPLASLSLDFSGRRKAQIDQMGAMRRSGIPRCKRDVRLVRPQHFAKIGMQAVVAHAWQQVAQFAYDPSLTAIPEADPLTEIADGHRFLVEGAHPRGGRLSERPGVAR